jgi:hypothetical protein
MATALTVFVLTPHLLNGPADTPILVTSGDLRSPTIQNLEIGLIKNPTLTVGRTIMMTTTAPVLDPRLIQRLQRCMRGLILSPITKY